MATSQLYPSYCNMNIEAIGNGVGALGSINGFEQMQMQLQIQMQMYAGNGNSNGKNGTRSKVKTSLCKKWMETGSCPYGYKCQFAHGLEQLRCNVDQNSYKTKPCNAFFKKGYCQYGDRCNFAHREFKQVTDTQEKQNSSKFIGYQQVIKEGLIAKQGGSRLLKIRGLNPQIYDEKFDGSTDDGKSQSLSVSRSSISSSKALSQSFVEFGQQSHPLSFSTTFFSLEHANSDKQSQALAFAENQQNFSIFPFYSFTSASTPSESDLEQQEQFSMQKQMQTSQNYFNFLI